MERMFVLIVFIVGVMYSCSTIPTLPNHEYTKKDTLFEFPLLGVATPIGGGVKSIVLKGYYGKSENLTFYWYNLSGNIVKDSFDYDGHINLYEYTGFKKIKSVSMCYWIDTVLNVKNTSNYSYDRFNRLTENTFLQWNDVGDSSLRITKYDYYDSYCLNYELGESQDTFTINYDFKNRQLTKILNYDRLKSQVFFNNNEDRVLFESHSRNNESVDMLTEYDKFGNKISFTLHFNSDSLYESEESKSVPRINFQTGLRRTESYIKSKQDLVLVSSYIYDNKNNWTHKIENGDTIEKRIITYYD